MSATVNLSGSKQIEALLGLFARRGCERVETPILQPAEVFLDLSGEDIRRRLYLTQDAEGRDFCLRPEHTIPVCRNHLATGRAAGEYCSVGPVFRQRGGEPGEFIQADMESIGRTDICPADADALSLALEGYAVFQDEPAAIRIGDMGLLGAVLDGLGVASPAKRRLTRGLASGQPSERLLEPDGNGRRQDYSGLLAAIEGQDSRAARAFVEDVISIAGVAQVGGRTAAEIAERFLAQSENRAGQVPDQARRVLRQYFAVSGGPDAAATSIRQLERSAGLNLSEALDRFRDRTGLMASLGIDLNRITFAADFARTLDYYTGFIFEVRSADRPDGPVMVGGGRYDRLLQQLGHAEPVPAVGCAFWLDRLSNGQAEAGR